MAVAVLGVVMACLLARYFKQHDVKRRGPIENRRKLRYGVKQIPLLKRIGLACARAMSLLAGPANTGVALTNALGTTFPKGDESLIVDVAVSLPVATRFLVWMRGADQYHANICDGNSAASHRPLGVSPDSPFQAGDFMTVQRFGAVIGTTLGISGGVITVDNLVVAAANGQVKDLTVVGAGTFWVVGVACSSTTAAGQEVTFISVVPYTVTQ